MGVSGSGKSLIGSGLAARHGWVFVDGDDLHPEANVAKMAAGIPLTDADRWPWLDAVAATLAGSPGGIVVACSALRRVYRDRIRAAAPDAVFVELAGSRELLWERMTARPGHFMPASLLDSQLATLEPLAPDEAGVIVSIDGPPAEVLARVDAAVTPRPPVI
ncbi:gluconate kinase, SKI family [Herbiconiux ginsengi]|uniref:Gluconokinase n=2 Tax=Herbiconiux ginsengi TaxID=381665 RepID=A0A1H3LDW3_9MICO|nr:gluconate kinase, SKI family [Herbiconiux ginsengi]